jgi:hypothetical protein
METAKNPDVPREPLALVAQPSELPHLYLAQRRPEAEERRHPRIATVPRIAKLLGIERRQVLRKALDHDATPTERQGRREP